MKTVTKRSTDNKLVPMCLEHPPISKKILFPKKGPLLILVIFSIFSFSVINGPDQSSITQIISSTDRSEIIGYSSGIPDLVATEDGGLTFIYRTETCGGIDHLLVKTNSSGMIQWKTSLIETGSDLNFYHIIQTHDGYVLAGDKTIKYRNPEICLIKIDNEGSKLWEVIYKNNTITEIIQLEDGGFAIVGRNGVTTSLGSIPILIKTDKNGNMVWNQTFSSSIQLKSLIQTIDGFILLGANCSEYRTSNKRVILIKLDEGGKVLWSKNYHEFGCPKFLETIPSKIIQTVDGIVITGLDEGQLLMIKIDPAGEEIWRKEFNLFGLMNKYYGYSHYLSNYIGAYPGDLGHNLMQIKGEDLVFTGCDFANFEWNEVRYTRLIKTDYTGNMQWNRSFYGLFNHLVEMSEGSYALAGSVVGEGACILNIDKNGTVLWKRVYTGSIVGEDWATCVIQTQDGGYAFAGVTSSYGAEKTDIWLVKTNDIGEAEWNTNVGGKGDEIAYSLYQTLSGDFFIIGSTNSFDSGEWKLFVAKVDDTGTLLWKKTYINIIPVHWGGKIPSSFQTDDGGIICACPLDIGGLWIAKIKGDGGIQWKNTYKKPWNFDCLQITDGGFIFTFLDEPSTEVYGTSVIKIDSSGIIEWTQFLRNVWGDIFQQTPDNGFIFLSENYCETNAPWSCSTNVSLVKLDPFGNIEWVQDFNRIKVSNSYFHQTPDNGYICILDGSQPLHPEDDSYYYLVKVDAQGMITWTKKYFKADSSGGDIRIANILITSESEYFLIHDDPWSPSYLILEKVNAQGVSQWTQNWNKTLFEGDLDGYSHLTFFQMEDEDILLAGVSSQTGRLFLSKISLEFDAILWNQTLPEGYLGRFNTHFSDYFLAKDNQSLIAIGDSWILNIHQNGSLLWNYTFYPFRFSSLVPTEDDGFVLAGQVSAMPGQYGVSRDAFVMKLDENMAIEWSRVYGSSSSGVLWSYEIEEPTPSNDSNSASSFPFLLILVVLCAMSFYKKNHLS